jgi:AraC-like DNA-binding protein
MCPARRVEDATPTLRNAEQMYPDESWWEFLAENKTTRHDFHEALYILDGVYEARLKDDWLRCGPHHLIYYPPRTWHEAMNSGKPVVNYMLIQWDGGPDADAGRQAIVRADPLGRLLTLARWLIDLSFRRKAGGAAMRQSVLQTFVLAVQEDQAVEAGGWLARVLAFIEDNIQNRLRLSDLQGITGMSRRTLLREFKQATGTSPMQYVQQLRLETAQRLLLSSNLPLKAIAEQVGLSSAFHLSDLIRRKLGRSPRQIRDDADKPRGHGGIR